MTKLFLPLITLLSLSCFANAKDEKAPKTLPGGWTYAWGDEFNGNKLNTKKWDYELGVIRNYNTSQTYTKENVEVKNGMLRIHTRAEETPNSRYDAAKDTHDWNIHMPSRPYSSGSITTKGIKNFKYGRMEVRAKLPKAKGSWPAIWMLGDNGNTWPRQGEIDILEHLTQEPGKCYGTVHWGLHGTDKSTDCTKTVMMKGCPYSEFHIFVLEWDEEHISIFVDGQIINKYIVKRATYPQDGFNPFKTPHYLIINTAVGGPKTWPEEPDAAQFPSVYEIDYVRYYTRDPKKK